jgi:N-acetylmuramoyl-L-alanine amidase
VTALCLLCLLVPPAFAASVQARKQQARSQFEIAGRLREELNGLPQKDRSRREYQRVIDAYRRVYYIAPTSGKADASVLAVAELLAESGRAFNDEKALRDAIKQYEFLRREYPGSKYRFAALFTIGQIYKDDLEENDNARQAFQEVIRRYPHLQLAGDAREAIADMEQQAHNKQKPRDSHAAQPKPQDLRLQPARAQDSKAQDSKAQDSKAQELPAEAPRNPLPLVTGIRHWSTPDYTRVAIDLEQEVKYEAGRVPNPDRIFFDLHDTKLASTLVGKTFDVSDGFLRRVRIAQFQKDMVRVVLEVDDVSDYSAFLLPNPYRLIIDIHGRKPNVAQTQVAHAQQEKEHGVPSAPVTRETKPELPASSPPASLAPSPPATPDAATAIPPAEPAGSASELTASFGPRMADGSFFSHPSPVAPASAAGNATSSSPQPAAKAESPRPAPPKTSPAPSPAVESTKSEVAHLDGPELKATNKPTSQPTVQVVAPRGSDNTKLAAGKKNPRYPEVHQAQPTANGERSLIRALGLKVGRIVIDAGHGGHDTGSIGPDGLLEKDLVLDVSLRLGRLLQTRMGAEVIYTRDDDAFVPLETRSRPIFSSPSTPTPAMTLRRAAWKPTISISIPPLMPWKWPPVKTPSARSPCTNSATW